MHQNAAKEFEEKIEKIVLGDTFPQTVEKFYSELTRLYAASKSKQEAELYWGVIMLFSKIVK